MAININIGPNSRMAKKSVLFSATGLNATNCSIVYEVEGNYRSWKPDRAINAITSIEIGKGYLIIAKTSLDLEEFFGQAIGGDGEPTFEYVVPDDGILII